MCMITYIHIYIYTHIYVCLHIDISFSLYIYIYIHTYMYIHICIYIYIYIYVYTYRERERERERDKYIHRLAVEVRCYMLCFGGLTRSARCNTRSRLTAAAGFSCTSRRVWFQAKGQDSSMGGAVETG